VSLAGSLLIVGFWICTACLIASAIRHVTRGRPPALSEQEAVRRLYGGPHERVDDVAHSNHNGRKVLR
jgi:hypothetical protein